MRLRKLVALGRLWRNLSCRSAVVLLWILFFHSGEIRCGAEGDPPRAAQPSRAPAKPWGELEYENIPLENSANLFLDAAERTKAPRWVFRSVTPAQLTELFTGCALPAAQGSFLLATNHWEILSNGIAISPPEELVMGLSQSARQRIYHALAPDRENYVQYFPFRFPLGTLDEHLADCHLPGDKLEMLRGLTYTNAGALCLCLDAPLQKRLATNEFQALIRALYSIPAVDLRLHIGGNADVDTLVRYWGHGGREKRIRPLLESLARVRGGGSVSVGQLFPAFARLRLDTFPDPESDAEADREDCVFTALNFFNEQADYSFEDATKAHDALHSGYAPIQGPPTFGDLVFLIDPAGVTAHVCVYIAADVVYTKNGANHLQPYVLMRIPEVLAFYPVEGSWNLVIFRKKGL